MENLKKYKLGEIGDIITGKTPSTFDIENYGEEYMFISPTDLHNGYKIEKTLKNISQKGFDSIKTNTIKGQSVLVGCIGWDMGNVGYTEKKCATNQQINSITNFKDFANPLYTYYWLKNKKDFLFSVASVTRTPILNKSSFSDIVIPLPELQNQMDVAKILSSLDDKIALNRRMNAKLEQMAKRLYDHWFLQFDFPNADGKPYKSSGGKMEYNEVLKREIPAGWEVTPLKECINHINTGLNPRDNFVLGNGNIKYITVKNLTESGMIDFSNCDLIDEEARYMVHNRSDIKIGDILFASICPLGRCYLINEEPKDWDINESVFTIRPNYKNMSSQFLYNILRDEYYVKKMTQKATGSIFKGIRVDDLEKMEIVLPSKEIIDSFTAKITPLLNQQAKLQQESMKLSEMRDKLLPLLMNGQVEVK